MTSKELRYAALVAERKECHRCQGVTNPADVRDGVFDSDEIGPWSRWQGSLSADLMIVGKDWQSREYFVGHEGWDEGISTDRTLLKLLESVDIEIGARVAGSSPGRIFATNAVLCLKGGSGFSSIAEGMVEELRLQLPPSSGGNRCSEGCRCIGWRCAVRTTPRVQAATKGPHDGGS